MNRHPDRLRPAAVASFAVASFAVALLAATALLSACADAPDQASPDDGPRAQRSEPREAGLRVTPLAAPTDGAAAFPRLVPVPDGPLLAAWLERRDGDESETRTALRLAEWADAGWSSARTLTSGADVLFNWADVPALHATAGGRVFAAWSVVVPGGDHATFIEWAASADGGQRWSKPAVLHDDRSPTEHAFPSFATRPDGDVAVAWLDGRAMTGDGGHGGHGTGAMQVRAARIGSANEVAEEVALDERACECCPTALLATPDGLLAAWRDRSESEVRDLAVAAWSDEGWSEGTAVADEGWTVPGCPVNGPALVLAGDAIVAAWYTGADETPRVLVAASADGGRSWGPAIRSDDGAPLGRATLAPLAPSTPSSGEEVVLGWLEQATGDEQAPTFRARRLALDDLVPGASLRPSVRVGPAAPARAGGFPRLAPHGAATVAAWTASEGEGARGLRLRFAKVLPEG